MKVLNKVCIYLRKSRKDRDNPDEPLEKTLERHRKTLMAYAQEHKLNIIEIKKEVVSGESLSKRPKMIEMLEEIEDGNYDAVLVMDIDRLCRGEMLDQGIIISTFKKNNTQIITLDKTYDLDDDLDEEMVDFNAFFARKELKTINKRLNRGRLKSLEEGNFISGRAPWGYDYDKGSKQLLVNEREKCIFLDIVDMYINKDMGAAQICNTLNESGIKSKMGKTWNKGTLIDMLKNPLYIGKITWSKNTNNPKIFDGKHKPLISIELFDKITEVSNTRYIPRVRNSYKGRNPLAGLIKCSGCKSTMVLRTYKNDKDTLRCFNDCGNKSTYIINIENRLINIIQSELKQIEYDFKYNKQPKENKKIVSDNLLNISKKELEKSYIQRNSLFELLEQKIYDNNTFLERMNVISARIADLEDTIKKIEDKNKEILKSPKEKKYNLKDIRDYIEFLDDAYWRVTAEEKNKFLRNIVDYAIFTKDEIGVELFKLEVFLRL